MVYHMVLHIVAFLRHSNNILQNSVANRFLNRLCDSRQKFIVFLNFHQFPHAILCKKHMLGRGILNDFQQHCVVLTRHFSWHVIYNVLPHFFNLKTRRDAGILFHHVQIRVAAGRCCKFFQYRIPKKYRQILIHTAK